MNLFADIRTLVVETLDAMVAEGELPTGLSYGPVAVEPPRDAAHGDMATNAAMVLAKPAGLPPREIAEALAARLLSDPRIVVAEVAGPGFLNLRLAPAGLARRRDRGDRRGPQLRPFRPWRGREGERRIRLGQPDRPASRRPHPGRGLRRRAGEPVWQFAGYDVTREYYINDGGAQVDVLARSAYERYREACGHAPEIADGLYPGDYLVAVGEALKDTVRRKPSRQARVRVARRGARPSRPSG